MEISPVVRDRAAGVLLGQAIGDALGVPYEFAAPIRPGEAVMKGGGLGPYEPGEWSDDTQMALCIARVGATGAVLTDPDALDAIAQAFIDWMTYAATDIGTLTSEVLARASHDDGRRLSLRMTEAAQEAAADGRASNGGLMRTAVVGLSALDSAGRTAEAARRVCSLTHAEPHCVDSAVLWSLAVRRAVLDGVLDLRSGLEHLPPARRPEWQAYVDAAEARPPRVFTPNGHAVTALQAAWAAIHSTREADGPEHVPAALQVAVSIGNDTDTVAAIAGGLLGARYGAAALPRAWVDQVHGWPGLRAPELESLALAVAGLSQD